MRKKLIVRQVTSVVRFVQSTKKITFIIELMLFGNESNGIIWSKSPTSISVHNAKWFRKLLRRFLMMEISMSTRARFFCKENGRNSSQNEKTLLLFLFSPVSQVTLDVVKHLRIKLIAKQKNEEMNREKRKRELQYEEQMCARLEVKLSNSNFFTSSLRSLACVDACVNAHSVCLSPSFFFCARLSVGEEWR